MFLFISFLKKHRSVVTGRQSQTQAAQSSEVSLALTLAVGLAATADLPTDRLVSGGEKIYCATDSVVLGLR